MRLPDRLQHRSARGPAHPPSGQIFSALDVGPSTFGQAPYLVDLAFWWVRKLDFLGTVNRGNAIRGREEATMSDNPKSICPTPPKRTGPAASPSEQATSDSPSDLSRSQAPPLRRLLKWLLHAALGKPWTQPMRADEKRTTDAWLFRLKAAYDAGYYKTEPTEGAQTLFPWQNKTCRDCPFWSNGICHVLAEYRGATWHTCAYFDPWNRGEALAIVRSRKEREMNRWRGWLGDGSARW